MWGGVGLDSGLIRLLTKAGANTLEIVQRSLQKTRCKLQFCAYQVCMSSPSFMGGPFEPTQQMLSQVRSILSRQYEKTQPGCHCVSWFSGIWLVLNRLQAMQNQTLLWGGGCRTPPPPPQYVGLLPPSPHPTPPHPIWSFRKLNGMAFSEI